MTGKEKVVIKERVLIIDERHIDKLTREVAEGIKQQIRRVDPRWRHSVHSISLLTTCLNVHRKDQVYVIGFDDVDLSIHPHVVEHIKLGEESIRKR